MGLQNYSTSVIQIGVPTSAGPSPARSDTQPMSAGKYQHISAAAVVAPSGRGGTQAEALGLCSSGRAGDTQLPRQRPDAAALDFAQASSARRTRPSRCAWTGTSNKQGSGLRKQGSGLRA